MAAHPAQQIPDPLTVPDWFAYLERVRSHLIAGYDALEEAQEVIRYGVRHSGIDGHAALLGLDIRVLARRVARPIGHAADLHLEAATALRTSEMLLRGALPSAGKKRDPRALKV